MFTCVAALVVAGSAFIVWEQITLRSSMARNISIQAAITADNCKAALAFEDDKDAEETLKTLRAESSIIFGCVYNIKGETFAYYQRDNIDNRMHLPKPQKDGYSFSGGFLTVFQNIILDGEKIGTVCLRSDLNLISEMLKRSAGIIGIVLLFVSLMAYLMSANLQKIISRPILRLADVTKSISQKKDYSVRVKKHSEDEISVLIDAFNQMLEQIQQHDSALLNVNIQLTKEVAERKKAESALEDLNKDLEATIQELSRSNRELQDFAHITAHDLKAPLRAIGTLSEWLATSYAEKFDEEGKQQVKLLVGRAKRMSELIDGILRYSELARTKRKAEEVDLNMLLIEIIRGIELPENIEIIIKTKLPTVVYEETRMIQVFHNLLTNAVKYMDKTEGQIELNCVEENNFWKFSISDNGPGIAEKYFEKIFKLFQTLSPRDEVESTGIGLPLVKKIIETYGGKIWVESEVGTGSTFFFTLPRSLDAAENNRCLLSSAKTKT
jgi:signal transduction histidine kinase